MGIALTSNGNINNSITLGDDFFRMSGSYDDDPAFGEPIIDIEQNVLAIAVGPNSEIDKFDFTYVNPANPTGQRDRIRIDPRSPFSGLLPISGVTPPSLRVVVDRPTNLATLSPTFGIRPTFELLFYFKKPTNTVGRPRPPRFVTGTFGPTAAPETIINQLYCYGRNQFLISVAKTAGANPITVRVAGRKFINAAAIVPVIETDLGTAVIPAGGGTALFTGNPGPFDLLRVYSTGIIGPGDVSYTMEVRDEG